MEETNHKPVKWWQWVLVYPTLLLGLLGSAPTILELYQSWKLDIDRKEVPLAQMQNKLWERNADCQFSPSDWGTEILRINIDAKVCPSGDILISTKSFDRKKYRWISLEDLVSDENFGFSFNFINDAIAAPVIFQSESQDNGTLICKRWVENGKLLRRISMPESGCYDEVINTYNGEVISKRPVSCDSSCT